jgi:hypothetical protein
VYVLWELNGESLVTKGISEVLAYQYDVFPSHAEIINYDKVRVQQKGVSTIITYDTKKGIELSRTVEKQ